MAKLLQDKIIASFRNQIELVSGHIAESLAAAARPRHFEALRSLDLPPTQVRTPGTLRQIAAGTRNLADLGNSSRPQLDASAHRVAIASRAHELEIDKMMTRVALVSEQQRWIAVVGDNNVEVAIVVEVSKRASAPGLRSCESRA